MKKFLILLFPMLFTLIVCQAQKQIVFKMHFMPERKYVSTMKMDMNMIMNMPGDTAAANMAKGSGKQYPMKMEMLSGMKMGIKTGKETGNGGFPVMMSIESLSGKMITNGVERPIPTNTMAQTIFATYKEPGKLRVDSIGGIKADDNMKEAMLKMINSMQTYIKFPDTVMRVGESFTQVTPMDMPVAGMAMKMDSKITYKLLSVTGNNANFDINYLLNMDMAGQKMNINMAGGGTGKMVFDISVGYPVSTTSNMAINYVMDMPQADKAKMSVKMNMIIDQQNIITQ